MFDAGYRPRPIRFLELVEVGGWQIKLYGAACERSAPRLELVEATKRLARRVLPSPADGEGRYAVGFACAHDGRGGCFSFVDWWADENELHHQIYVAPEERPTELSPAGPDALTACVWDLAIMSFERDAWLETVMRNPAGPDFDAYLAARLDAVV
ncbi:MAG: isochorismatase [Thermoleophilaceae bacterium]|nr:isochorismatase [Thermoleophilaceae bacterium]